MAIELGYFTIGVRDVPRGAKFYGGLFGWTFEDVGEQYAHVSNTVLPCGLNKSAPVDLTSFYFRVDDIEAAVAKVKALGGKTADVTKSPSGLGARCTDDQGTTFSLWQAAEGY